MGLALASFARYVASLHHRDAPTANLMTEWARHGNGNRDNPLIWARRLKLLRPFTRYLRQLDESVFGPVPGRLAPHIYRDEEIVDLLMAARELQPHDGLRPATFETLFGLIASTGLRVSETLDLLDADVELRHSFAVRRLMLWHAQGIDVDQAMLSDSGSRVNGAGGRQVRMLCRGMGRW